MSDESGAFPFDFESESQSAKRPLSGQAASDRRTQHRLVRLTTALIALGTVQALGVAIAALSIITRWLMGE